MTATEKIQYVQPYRDAQSPPRPVPAGGAWPIPAEHWRDFVDTDTVVTFTLVVPLKVVAQGYVALLDYFEEAFDEQVHLDSCEFRVVGEASSNEDFDGTFCGDLNLQVTCALRSRA